MSGGLVPETDAAFGSGVGSTMAELITWVVTSVGRAVATSSGSGNRLLAFRSGLQGVRERVPEYEKKMVDLALDLGIRDVEIITERLRDALGRVGQSGFGLAASLGGQDSIYASREAANFASWVQAYTSGIRARVLPRVEIERRRDNMGGQNGGPIVTVAPPARRRALAELLENPESTWLDWKTKFPPGLVAGSKNPEWERGRSTILKDIVCIANSIVDECGYLVFGVEDLGASRRVVGVGAAHFDDAVFQDWNRVTFDPPVEFHYTEVPDGAATVGIVEIRPSSDYPHVCRTTVGDLHEGQVWRRSGTRNTVASRRDLAQMFAAATPIRTTQNDGDVVRQVRAVMEPLGWEPFWAGMNEVDDKLAQGYRLAYAPESRRQVRWAPSNVDAHVLMIRKKA